MRRHITLGLIALLVLTTTALYAAGPMTVPGGTSQTLHADHGFHAVAATEGQQDVTLSAIADVAGQPCSQATHDAYVTVGPDGHNYPTWHPPVDPASGCVFGHEHGDDPATSAANSSPPPFGYIAAVAGHAPEPHEGFKVFVIPAGTPTDLGPTVADVRIVFHHGTAAVGRYTNDHHSLMYDYVATDGTGREFHTQGLADTGPNALDGSTCDSPRKGARDFSTLGCSDPYEIWNNVHFEINAPGDFVGDAGNTTLHVSLSSALFDPITTRDPSNNARLLYTATANGLSVDPLSTDSPYRGCNREIYQGPNFWRNAGRATTYQTDAFGKVDPSGVFTQQVSAVTYRLNDLFKTTSNHCDPSLRSPN